MHPGAIGVEIRRVLERENLAQFFVAVVAAEDAPNNKPAPDPYLHAVARLGAACGGQLSPGECVAIEDSHWGLESARTAGLKTVAVTHTYERHALSADLVGRGAGQPGNWIAPVDLFRLSEHILSQSKHLDIRADPAIFTAFRLYTPYNRW